MASFGGEWPLGSSAQTLPRGGHLQDDVNRRLPRYGWLRYHVVDEVGFDILREEQEENTKKKKTRKKQKKNKKKI